MEDVAEGSCSSTAPGLLWSEYSSSRDLIPEVGPQTMGGTWGHVSL